MAAMLKPQGAFVITPHKVSVCILVQVYAPPAQISVPFPFSSISQHNRLGLFLLSLIKSCDDILEPTLNQFMKQLQEFGGLLNDWLSDHISSRLSSLSSPDDLFNFFSELRGILGGHDTNIVDDDQINLDPNSNLGMYLRRCLLAFNTLSFEGVCHLLTNIGTYYKEAVSSCLPHELSNLDDSCNDPGASSEYENMDLEKLVFKKVTEEFESRKNSIERVPFHNHSPKAFFDLVQDSKVSSGSKLKRNYRAREGSPFVNPPSSAVRGAEFPGAVFLRTNWQIQGYLSEQADAVEKHGSSFPMSAFESVLKQLQKMAPELHRVHFLRYLNSLYHDDYPAALENLHRYFDYSAGTEGSDFVPPSSSGTNHFGGYEVALLCLGMTHFHFGHPKQGLEVLTEAVRVCQQHSDDACLAYTLAAICNLLSEIGISNTTGIVGASPMTSIGASQSVQQQLFVLLKRSLKRAESLKLKRLVASSHMAMAKFDLAHVQRPLLSFGPKASVQLRTCPSNVCKELRLSSYLIREVDNESSIMTTDGALSTSWLRDLRKPTGSLVFSQESVCGSNSHAFHFCAQPSSIPGSVQQLIGSSYLVRATSWELYGSTSLARLNALICATCFSDSLSSADVALAYGKLILHLAVFKGYREAFAALKIAEAKFLSVSRSRILLVKLQLIHEWALHRGHLKLAQQVCDELGVLASSVIGVDLELKTEASLRLARTLLAANQFSQAASVAHSLFCTCYKYNLHVENATVLLLLAEIHKKSGNAVLGIPYALASLSFCQSFNLDLLKASATLTLAELWLALGSSHAKRALNLIHSAFPIILGQGSLELRSRAYIAEAKCYLSDLSFSVFDDPEVVLDSLRQASEALELLEYHELAAEAFYLMAVVFDLLGQLDKREEAAAAFKKHTIALGSSTKPEDPHLNML